MVFLHARMVDMVRVSVRCGKAKGRLPQTEKKTGRETQKKQAMSTVIRF